jgi:hypothetical protein
VGLAKKESVCSTEGSARLKEEESLVWTQRFSVRGGRTEYSLKLKEKVV